MKRFLSVFLLLMGFVVTGKAYSADALIVWDSNDGYSSQIKDNLTTILTNLGLTVTQANVPTASLPSLATFNQVWDVRFDTAITSGDETSYVSYLNGGGSLFLMGEFAPAYITRDNSITALISSAGGGSVTVASGSVSGASNVVSSPFTGPISISTVNFQTSGYFTSLGAGSEVTHDPTTTSNITAAYWPVGTLSNATSGTLIVVLDVNFLGNAPFLQSDFASNLASYLAAPSPSPSAVPTLSEWAQLMLGLLVMTMIGWHFHRQRSY